MRSISKVLIASAIAASCGYAGATITQTSNGVGNDDANNYALEGLQIAASTALISTGDLAYELGGSYALDDQLHFALGGTAGASYGSAGTQPATFTCTDTAGATIIFTLQGGDTAATATNLVYKVTSKAGATVGSCAIPSLTIAAASINAEGSITVSNQQVKAAAGGVSADSSAAINVGSVNSVYTIGNGTVFDGVVDVTDDRLSFASNGGPRDLLAGVEDSFSFTVTRDATPTMIAAATGTMVLTLTAASNFNYLIEPGTTTCDTDGTGAATASVVGGAVGTIAVNSTCSQLTVTIPTIADGEYVVSLGRGSATVTTTTAAAFLEQAYTASAAASVRGATTRSAAFSGTPSAGSWTINGTTVTIPYMPVNANIDLIVNIANQSTQTGTVTFTARNADGQLCSGTLGTIGANANSSFGGALKSAMLACVGNEWTSASRATVAIVAPIPSATTFVNTSFSTNDGRSRQIVINSQN